MPHIKSIRLVNVHFNNATQFYDDFRMELGGSNTTYDLENGGGKSLLLLMLLQTVLPKSSLRREKPLSLIFQGGKDRTSHVAVEWLLEEGGGYKYLLTGFSARKRRAGSEPAVMEGPEDEETLQSGDIEHLNWCLFYNDNQLAAIKSPPLLRHEGGHKGYAGFEDIRKYIQQMQQKGLPAQVFDRIDKYQSYISGHHLLSAEWNIIKGINSGENNIESYFRQNTTSRKLIENQFVKIIEDVETLNKGEKNPEESLLLADTLLEIRNRLQEYLRLKGHMAEYEQIKDYYDEFSRHNEEFLMIYQDYEAHKRQAAAIRNLLNNNMLQLDKERAATREKLEADTAGRNEGLQLKRLLEAGLVDFEKEGLQTLRQHLEAARDRVAQRQTELEKQLNDLLTLEGYGEYRSVKFKVSEICRSLQMLGRDEDSVQEACMEAGGRLWYLTDRLLTELEAEQGNIEATKVRLEKELAQNQSDLIEGAEKTAVLGEQIRSLTEKVSFQHERLQELSAFFLGRGEMEAVLSPAHFADRLDAEYQRCLQEKEAVSARIKISENELQDLALEVVRTEEAVKSKLESKKPLAGWLENWQREMAVLENKAAGFGQSTVEGYQDVLQSLIHKETFAKLEKEIEAGRRRQKKQLSGERGYYVPNEEILALAEKMSTKCQFVQAGIDWIAAAEPQEKEKILRTWPYLPFAVIVDRESFAKLKKGGLKLDFASDYPVPVVNLETLRQPDDWAGRDIYYFCSFADLLLESSCFEQYLQSLEAELEAMAREIRAAETRIEELGTELSAADIFLAAYPRTEIQERKHRLAELEKEIADLKKCLHGLQEKRDRLLQEQDLLKAQEEELRKQIAEGLEKREKLAESRQRTDDLAELRVELSAKHQELETLQARFTGLHIAAAGLQEQKQGAENQLQNLNMELHDVRKDKEQLARFTAIANDFGLNRIRAEYKTLQEAVSGRNSEENELRSSLEEYEARLEALRQRILRDYGGNLEELAQSEESGVRITVPLPYMINEASQNKAENSENLKTAEAKVTEVRTQIEKIQVKLDLILEGLEDEQKKSLPHYDSQSRYQQELEQVEQLVKSYEGEIERANEELTRLRDEYSSLERQKEDYEAFVEREEVLNEGTTASETREFREYEKEYRHLQALIRQQCEKWGDRLKTIEKETAHYIITEPMEELGKISKPVSAAQCLVRREAFADYIANISEQMEKIISDIRQLESYQEDFTRRCIQRAELVLGHLRKLEALSRIEVYGRRTNMIELKLQEFEEKDKQLWMKAHIDGIVREIGQEGIDRKRVAARLSTRELLARIADMDKAVVRLYKIESIPENSRFYRWENAVGSEGQNNSLYFIFAACLISFVRMLSITGTSVRTKKVIIADNPFGATSAVYLWDPMFKIMKQNDIQLIAPGHRIPREITSRFGVSYLLNQDILQDGRMRVVVKDVRVEENEDVLRYIDPEQFSLFKNQIPLVF
jgi:hypothetical protein